MNLKFAVVALTLVTVVRSSCLFGADHELTKLLLSWTGETVFGESEEYPAGDTYNVTDTKSPRLIGGALIAPLTWRRRSRTRNITCASRRASCLRRAGIT